ncbi:hypothetical protein L1987_80482 [Smallanthus sonchifolius]|uniref:Uncharacterized protein n=1 Tax=Smallanthus sonchifolius TaxID=185202 RepID=A0ACB8YN74_9ASTR|nr:hypothetical protein L1987_80482 [Smallanthus sonchifolius]
MRLKSLFDDGCLLSRLQFGPNSFYTATLTHVATKRRRTLITITFKATAFCLSADFKWRLKSFSKMRLPKKRVNEPVWHPLLEPWQ